MSEIDNEFHAWRAKKGFTGVQTREQLDAFLTERKNTKSPDEIKADVDRWLKDNPDYLPCDSNRGIINEWLDMMELQATYVNLDRAYRMTQARLIHRKPEPVLPEQPETRPGVWRNGIFTPFETGSGIGNVKKFGVGQSAPGVSVEDAVIRKRPEAMSAEEFAKACRTSKAFRDKYDK